MTPQEHIDKIATEFDTEMRAKYAKGQAEHGGSLWLKSGIIDMAIEEAIDLVVYLKTLKQQLEEGKLGTKNDNG